MTLIEWYKEHEVQLNLTPLTPKALTKIVWNAALDEAVKVVLRHHESHLANNHIGIEIANEIKELKE